MAEKLTLSEKLKYFKGAAKPEYRGRFGGASAWAKPIPFAQKLKYMAGKLDPFKPQDDKTPSVFEQAVASGDLARIEFFLNLCPKKPKPEDLGRALQKVRTSDVLALLDAHGAKLPDDVDKQALEKHLYFVATQSRGDLKTFISSAQKHNLPEVFQYNDEKISMFDLMRRVGAAETWLEDSTEDQVGHEFRQAAADGNLDKVQYLLDSQKVDVNATNKHRKTAMMYAMQRNDFKMGHLLYYAGADMAFDDDYGRDPLFFANDETRQKMLEVFAQNDDVKSLKVAAKDGIAFSSPQLAVRANNKETLAFLAEHNAPFARAVENAFENEKARLNNGLKVTGEENAHSFVGLAKMSYNQKTGATKDTMYDKFEKLGLLDKWLEMASEQDKDKELDASIKANKLSLVARLLSSGARDVNAVDKDGKTLMMKALESNSKKVVDFLYYAKADLSIKDKEGKPTFAYADDKMKADMMILFAQKDDIQSMQIAEKAGASFDNESLVGAAHKRETLEFLAAKKAPFLGALQQAQNADMYHEDQWSASKDGLTDGAQRYQMLYDVYRNSLDDKGKKALDENMLAKANHDLSPKLEAPIVPNMHGKMSDKRKAELQSAIQQRLTASK